jgi:hypothetical protein
MKNTLNNVIITLVFFTSMCCIVANAQDLPGENKLGIRAPANIKIDGKANEWNNKLQEYSHHTQFYYTVSNDDRYLYLTVQTGDDYIINRILKGGITFTINKSGTKKDPDGIHITYPLLYHFGIYLKDLPKIKDKSAANVSKIDTFVNTVNDNMEKVSKLIKVSGIKDIDTVISVYNLDGIKAAASLDHQLRYTYELAVSLTNLGLSINNPLKFAYQVMINQTDDGSVHSSTSDGIRVTISSPRWSQQEATDFWGEYVLAK